MDKSGGTNGGGYDHFSANNNPGYAELGSLAYDHMPSIQDVLYDHPDPRGGAYDQTAMGTYSALGSAPTGYDKLGAARGGSGTGGPVDPGAGYLDVAPVGDAAGEPSYLETSVDNEAGPGMRHRVWRTVPGMLRVLLLANYFSCLTKSLHAWLVHPYCS